MSDNIDPERLISLVENHPVIWDKTLDEYKDKVKTLAAWREICTQFEPNFESLPEENRKEIGKCIAKKWTNIKDCWMKYNRLQTNNLVSGAATTTKRKYIYYEQMRFLKKISTPADTDSSLATTESAEQDNSFVRPATSATKRKRNVPPTDDIDKKILHILEKSDKTESPHISFFRGILPSLEQLNTDQVLDFQAGVLQLLKQIKNCNPIASQMNYMHPSSSQFHNIPNTSFPNLTSLNSVSQASSISLTSSCNPNSTLPLQSPASDYSYSVSSNESEIDLQLL